MRGAGPSSRGWAGTGAFCGAGRPGCRNGPQARQRLLAWRASGVAEPVVELVLADLAASDAQLEAAVQRLESAWQRMGTQACGAALNCCWHKTALMRPAPCSTKPWRAAVVSTAATLHWPTATGIAWQAVVMRRWCATVQAWRMPRDRSSRPTLGAVWGGRCRSAEILHPRAKCWPTPWTLAPGRASLLGLQATAATEALRLQEADAGFNAALARQGDDYESLAGAGFLALRQGDPEAARRWLLKALVIEPRYARAHVWLAVAEYTLGGQGAALIPWSARARRTPKTRWPGRWNR